MTGRWVCEYCRTVQEGLRCKECGAPREDPRPEVRTVKRPRKPPRRSEIISIEDDYPL